MTYARIKLKTISVNLGRGTLQYKQSTEMTWCKGITSCGATGCGERHLEVFAEPARVGVDDRLRVAERFQQRIHLKNSLFQLTIRRLTNCIHLFIRCVQSFLERLLRLRR